jgi:hypothetical protein
MSKFLRTSFALFICIAALTGCANNNSNRYSNSSSSSQSILGNLLEQERQSQAARQQQMNNASQNANQSAPSYKPVSQDNKPLEATTYDIKTLKKNPN